MPFITKLFDMVNAFTGHENCFKWSDDGSCFWVSNIELFSREVLPCYFKHNNYASFVRQLNFYGFRRSTEQLRGEGCVEVFRHPSFLRGRRDLLALIQRKAATPMAKRTKAEMEDEDVSIHSQASPAHDANEDLEELRLRCSRLEAQVVSLLEHNHMTNTQLHRQNETLSAVVMLLNRLGLTEMGASIASSSSPDSSTPAYEVQPANEMLPMLHVQLTSEEIDAQLHAEFLQPQMPMAQVRTHGVSPRAELYHRDNTHPRYYLEEPTPGQDVVYTFDDTQLGF